LTSKQAWYALEATQASEMLFTRCVELMLRNEAYLITADLTSRVLTQRLYGDYRLVCKTPEYKRAEKHVKLFKNTGLGRTLF